jgi:hypothetical protein
MRDPAGQDSSGRAGAEGGGSEGEPRPRRGRWAFGLAAVALALGGNVARSSEYGEVPKFYLTAPAEEAIRCPLKSVKAISVSYLSDHINRTGARLQFLQHSDSYNAIAKGGLHEHFPGGANYAFGLPAFYELRKWNIEWKRIAAHRGCVSESIGRGLSEILYSDCGLKVLARLKTIQSRFAHQNVSAQLGAGSLTLAPSHVSQKARNPRQDEGGPRRHGAGNVVRSIVLGIGAGLVACAVSIWAIRRWA